MNKLQYAEQKLFCTCIDVYKIYEGDEYEKLYEVLSTLQKKEIKKKQYLE